MATASPAASAAPCGRLVHLNEYSPPDDYRGWFKAMRSNDALEVISVNPNAYVLAAIIAMRSRWKKDGFNAHGLEQGEAFLGDFDEYGMSRRQYRTAKAQLEKWGFATFKPTNKGTRAKLISTALFAVVNLDNGHQPDQRPATLRPPTDQRPATNEERKTGKKVRNDASLSGHVIKNPELIELMQMAAAVLGPKEMGLNHQRWLNRAQDDPEKLRRVLADTRNKAIEEGLANPAAWAETMWGKVFK